VPGPIIFEADVQIAIVLASIGYLGEGTPTDEKHQLMSAALRQPDLPTGGRWRIVWGPAEWPTGTEPSTSLWYIAAGLDAQGDPALGIVIRGTQMSVWESKKLDLELELVPIPFADPTAPADVRVAQGFAKEIRNLFAAVDLRSGLSGEQFLRQYVSTSSPRPKVKVIGHSLGGATSPIFSLWVKSLFPDLEVRPFPFGGQSPGNRAFADWYANAFAPWPSRYINRLDVTWMMFAELAQIKTMWGGPDCPEWVKLLIDGVEELLRFEQLCYASTAGPHIFEGALYDLSGDGAWEMEARAQHEHLYYMFLSGIPLQVIRNGLGPKWSPPPKLGQPPGGG